MLSQCSSSQLPQQPPIAIKMLFFSFFKTLVDQEVTVELKNDIQIRGTLKSVDQYLNIKLDDISVVEEIKYPHLVSMEPAHDYAPPKSAKTKLSRLASARIGDGHGS
ncbi:hypothetical protein VE03_07278 [Pseudogymnoascus sp. 23342-1-I1]|nr:hypothetical protein VE03_07278 [Pseudogymnoascus sp. 23342-1-I1]